MNTTTNDINITFGDRLVGLFSQRRFDQRVRAKEASRFMDMQMRALFKSAERNRLNADWNVPLNFDINRVLLSELPLMRARSRWLMVNNSDAKSAQNAMVNYIVGTGFDLQTTVVSTVPNGNGMPIVTEFEGFNSFVDDVHRRWATDVSATTPENCPMSHYEFQVMALERWIQDGEVFVHLIPSKQDILKFEFIEPEALDTMKTSNGDNPVIMGVEIDARTQRPVAYWVHRVPMQDLVVYGVGESERVPASRMIHAFIRKYPRQVRGIPWLSAVMERIKQSEDYRFAQLVRNKIAAFFAVMFSGDAAPKKMLDDGTTTGTNSGNMPTDLNGNPITTLAPGLMGSLPSGVKPEIINPTSPENTYHDFLKSLQSASASGIEFGMSYQLMSRDTNGVTFAGGRLVTQMDTQGFRPAQKMFASKLLAPAHRVWLEFAVMSGKITASNFFNDRKFWTAHEWLPSGWNFGVNPLQEVNASRQSMEVDLTTFVDECSRLGHDWKAQLRKAKKVRDYRSQLGLPDLAVQSGQLPPPDPENAEMIGQQNGQQ